MITRHPAPLKPQNTKLTHYPKVNNLAGTRRILYSLPAWMSEEVRMWQQIGKLAAMLSIVALPLAWGLGVEYVFDLLRRRGAARPAEVDEL